MTHPVLLACETAPLESNSANPDLSAQVEAERRSAAFLFAPFNWAVQYDPWGVSQALNNLYYGGKPLVPSETENEYDLLINNLVTGTNYGTGFGFGSGPEGDRFWGKVFDNPLHREARQKLADVQRKHAAECTPPDEQGWRLDEIQNARASVAYAALLVVAAQFVGERLPHQAMIPAPEASALLG